MAKTTLQLIHIFVDHSNMWGGARAASRIRDPQTPDELARISVPALDTALGGQRQGVATKIVSGGIPPGMEGLWHQYEQRGYNTQQLFRDPDWRERGVDHSIICHMWRLLARSVDAHTHLVLASGDGRRNEFATSFFEVLEEVLLHERYQNWQVTLASFDWKYDGSVRSPTNTRMRHLVEESQRGRFLNLLDHYDKIVYHQPEGKAP